MKHIKIFDTTLRDGEQTPRVNLNSEEKLRIARQLESLGVDIIEAGFAVSSPGDFEAVKLIADNIKTSTVTSLARAMKKDIEAAAEALKGAVKPRIHTFIATSPIHREFKLKMTKEEKINYNNIKHKYFQREKELDLYRNKKKQQAFTLFSKYFTAISFI